MKRFIAGFFIWFVSLHAYALDVFFVHSYHHAYPWVQEYYNAFSDHLNSSSLIDYQMDTKRIPTEQFQERADEVLQLIEQTQPKVVVVSDDNALRLVGKPALEQGFNVVFLGINGNPRLVLPLTHNLAGVLERPLLKRSVAELSRVLPKLNKILVLMDDGPTTTAIVETSFANQLSQEIAGVRVDVQRLKTFVEWQVSVKQSKAQGYDLIIMANYAKLLDQNGKTVPLDATSAWTSQYADLPVFGFWRYSVGKDKAVGGLVLTGQDQGKRTAEIVNYFLNENNFPLPHIITPKKGRYLFSKTQVARWNIQLPEIIEKQVEWIE